MGGDSLLAPLALYALIVSTQQYSTNCPVSDQVPCLRSCTYEDGSGWKINLARCNLQQLPELSGGHIFLLILEVNKLTQLSADQFSRVDRVSELYLADNSIISTAFLQSNAFTSLVYIDLSYNQISDISADHFSKLNSLMELVMAKGGLVSLDFLSSGGLNSLMVVDVGLNNFSNGIQEGTFFGKTSLQELRMRDSFISGTQFLQCSDLHNLGTLRLEGNNLATIAKDQFLYLSSLQYLDIRYNPMNCNCSLLWLKTQNRFTVTQDQEQQACLLELQLTGLKALLRHTQQRYDDVCPHFTPSSSPSTIKASKTVTTLTTVTKQRTVTPPDMGMSLITKVFPKSSHSSTEHTAQTDATSQPMPNDKHDSRAVIAILLSVSGVTLITATIITAVCVKKLKQQRHHQAKTNPPSITKLEDIGRTGPDLNTCVCGNGSYSYRTVGLQSLHIYEEIKVAEDLAGYLMPNCSCNRSNMEDVKRNKLQLNPVALSDPAAVRGIREDSAGYLIPDNAGSRSNITNTAINTAAAADSETNGTARNEHLYKTIASRQRTQDDSLSAERDKEDGTATDWYEHLRHSKRDGEESTESKSYELLRHSTREGEDSVESKSYELLRHSTRRQHYSTLSTHGYIDVIPT